MEPFRKCLFYIPSVAPITLPIEIIIGRKDEEMWGEVISIKNLISIKIHGTEILNQESNHKWHTTVDFNQFIDKLHLELCVPLKRLRVSTNEIDRDNLELQIPIGRLLN